MISSRIYSKKVIRQIWRKIKIESKEGRKGGSERPRVATILARITVVAIKLGFPTWNPCSPIHIFSVQL